MQIQECTGQTRTPQQGSRQLHRTTRRFGIEKAYRELRTSRMNCIISDRHAWRGPEKRHANASCAFDHLHQRPPEKTRIQPSNTGTRAAKQRHTRPWPCGKISQALHDSLVLIGYERKNTRIMQIQEITGQTRIPQQGSGKCIVPRQDSERENHPGNVQAV